MPPNGNFPNIASFFYGAQQEFSFNRSLAFIDVTQKVVSILWPIFCW